ncbi:hypothetical protein BFJ63_vAg6316 [Fusarium oxysporum f. sp. narcissi]|nr:hypothetical protein BFJ63_vAg6316 [Fusarium oxysporum f. sp. narcissi]
MTYNNSVPAHGYIAPMAPSSTLIIIIAKGVAAACDLALLALLYAMMISAYIVLITIIIALILGITNRVSRWYGNILPFLGGVILFQVFGRAFCTTSNNNWSAILTPLKNKTKRELGRLFDEQQDLKDQIREQLTLHLDQSAEIAEWVEVPRAIVRDRINRRKTFLEIQKRATKVRVRRELYSRVIGYFDTLEERKRGQRISWRDLYLAAWIHTYCMNLWIFDMAFTSIWAVMSLFELVLVFATEPWGVELKLLITH